MENKEGARLSNLEKLRSKVESLPWEEVTPGMMAALSVELVKEGVKKGDISPQAAMNFSQGLMDYCFFPVTTGTEQNPIFPADKIVQARPLIIERQRRFAEKEGVDFDEMIRIRRDKAKVTEQALRDLISEQRANYGPFFMMMKPKDILNEASKKAEGKEIAKQVLEGIPSSQFGADEENIADRFMSTDVPNYFFGRELVEWIEDNYQIA